MELRMRLTLTSAGTQQIAVSHFFSVLFALAA